MSLNAGVSAKDAVTLPLSAPTKNKLRQSISDSLAHENAQQALERALTASEGAAQYLMLALAYADLSRLTETLEIAYATAAAENAKLWCDTLSYNVSDHDDVHAAKEFTLSLQWQVISLASAKDGHVPDPNSLKDILREATRLHRCEPSRQRPLEIIDQAASLLMAHGTEAAKQSHAAWLVRICNIA